MLNRFALRIALAAAWLLPTCGPAAAQNARPAEPPASSPAKAVHRVPLELKLPRPAFKGTPKDAPKGTNLEEARKGPRPPLLVPSGVALLSKGAKVTSSDSEPIVGKLSLVTDGEAEATEGGYVELGPGLQWVQIELPEPAEIAAIAVWHYHNNARIYHDVVVQVSDDPKFAANVQTLFNNDHDNSAKLGVGRDKEYWDTFEGRLIDAGGARGRYVRLYSNGSTADDLNHYTEVQIYGAPPK